MLVSAMTERQADMAGDNHGAETQEESQTAQEHGQQQATQDQPQVSGKDWESLESQMLYQIAKR